MAEPFPRAGEDALPLFPSSIPSSHASLSSSALLSPAVWRAVALGQLISLCVSVTGVCSQYLANAGVNVPTAQSTINYFLLSLLLLLKRRRDGNWTLRLPVWKYACLALADVEANYMVVKAYQYTSITSVMLLDCFTIPCVMVLSFLFLRAKYKARHCVGIFLCLGGLVLQVVSDSLSKPSTSGTGDKSSMVIGDLLCLGASLGYALSNTGQEAAVKRYDRVEFLGMLGLCGLVINTLQLVILERQQLSGIEWTGTVTRSFLGFSAVLFAMYILTSRYLGECDATVFNLSMLSSDAWGAMWSLVLFHNKLSPLYLIALAIVVVGVVLYNTAGYATEGMGGSDRSQAVQFSATGSAGSEWQETLPSEEATRDKE